MPEPPVGVSCPECGYDLRGIPEVACPECGFRYDARAIRALMRDWHVNRLAEMQYALALQGLACALAVVPMFVRKRYGIGLMCAVAAVLVARRIGKWVFPSSNDPPSWPFAVFLVLGACGYIARSPLPAMLILVAAVIFAGEAWRRYRGAWNAETRQSLLPALSRELWYWHCGNLAAMVATIGVLIGFMRHLI